MVRFSFWVHFSKCVLPERLTKELPEIARIPKYLDLIDRTVVSPPISTCKIDATKKQMHDLKTGFRDPEPENRAHTIMADAKQGSHVMPHKLGIRFRIPMSMFCSCVILS